MRLKDITAEMLLAASKNTTTLAGVARNMGIHERYFKIRVLDVLLKRTKVDLRSIVLENAKLAELNKPKVEYTCKMCGKVFTELPGAYASGDFCSKTCARKYAYRNVGKQKKIIACSHCGTLVKADSRTSHILCKTCRKKFGCQTSKYRLPASLGAELNRETCLFCGAPISKLYRACGKRFCSAECATKQRSKDYIEKIEKTGAFKKGKDGEAHRKIVRNYLIKKYGNKCSICGISDWNGKPITMNVDHIDGNAFNLSISNFRLVCPNCDSQLPTYKGRNRGRGRKARLLASKSH